MARKLYPIGFTPINAKHYADAFALQDKPVVKVGINYTITKEISTLDWVIE